MEVQYVWCCAACNARPRPGHSRQSWGGDDRRGHSDSYTAASCPGAALPTPDMPGPALTRNIGAEERSTAAAALEIRSTVMQACLTDYSEDQQRHQEGWHSPCGWMLLLRGNYKEQHPGAALPAPLRPVRSFVVMTGTWSWKRWRPASSSIWS